MSSNVKFRETTPIDINKLWIDAALAAARGDTGTRYICDVADIIVEGYKKRVTEYCPETKR